MKIAIENGHFSQIKAQDTAMTLAKYITIHSYRANLQNQFMHNWWITTTNLSLNQVTDYIICWKYHTQLWRRQIVQYGWRWSNTENIKTTVCHRHSVTSTALLICKTSNYALNYAFQIPQCHAQLSKQSYFLKGNRRSRYKNREMADSKAVRLSWAWNATVWCSCHGRLSPASRCQASQPVLPDSLDEHLPHTAPARRRHHRHHHHKWTDYGNVKSKDCKNTE